MKQALTHLDPVFSLTEQEIQAFEDFRQSPPWAQRLGCYAPVRTMSFHPTGKVLSCARKPSTVMGDIRTQRLDQIWNSPLRKAMLEALARFEYPAGCAVCSRYIASGDYVTADAVRTYDMEPLTQAVPEWPSRLEFNLSNTCALQCAMCSGEYSSTIRALREKRPPLRSPYGDQFFEDVQKYLAHASCAIFLGGEPFQQRECFRIWNILIGMHSNLHCYVNTNGMVFNAKVDDMLSQLRMTIAISFDGATASTVEAIRGGASFATMLKNAKEFSRRVGRNGGSLIFNFCPMRSNWHEFADFLLMAEEHEASAYVNTMADPEEMSLYFLPRNELQAIVATLEQQAQDLAGKLKRTMPAMQNLIAILRNKLQRTDRDPLRTAFASAINGWSGPDLFEDSEATRRSADYIERGRRILATPSYPGALAVHHARGIYPHYAERSEGAFFQDASGRRYLDWYMSGGAVALGHNHPAVVQAIHEQIDRGVNLSQPSTLEVEVAEQLCSLVPSAEMVAFGKNGTDVTAAAVRLARVITGREQLLICGYHGFQDWSWAAEPSSIGIPSSYRELVHPFPFNDLLAAKSLMEQHGSRIAAIVIEPVRYEGHSADFLLGLRQLADQYGALLIFDEVVTGFRVAPGGIQEVCGIRPDLTCVAKAIANGMPLAALLGSRRMMRHMPETNFGMTYRFEGLSLAAARASLDTFANTDVSGHLRMIGERMREGFEQAAQRNALDWHLDAHPALSYFRIEGGGRLTQRGAEALFAQICLRNGIFIRMPRLLPSLAHTVDDVERTLLVVEDAMHSVRQAMDHGLEGYLDGPIWNELQNPKPTATSPNPRLRSSTVSVPFPFEADPSDVLPSELYLTVNASDETSSAEVKNSEIVLRIGTWSHAAPATCSVDPPEAFVNPAMIEARYAVDEMPRNAAAVMVQLCLTDADGKQVYVCHDLVFGGGATSRATAGEVQKTTPCPYGVHGGAFRLTFANGGVSIEHETEWTEKLGNFSFEPSGDCRVSFRLHGSLEGGPAQVRLLDLKVTLAKVLSDKPKWSQNMPRSMINQAAQSSRHAVSAAVRRSLKIWRLMRVRSWLKRL